MVSHLVKRNTKKYTIYKRETTRRINKGYTLRVLSQCACVDGCMWYNRRFINQRLKGKGLSNGKGYEGMRLSN